MPIDLRSDTVTKPTAAMFEAMAMAELGDDVLGHDPTTRMLETTVAKLLGKEDALFMPSGTMANQVALATHTKPGDSVLFDDDAHMVFYECGAPAVMSAVQVRTFRSQDGVVDVTSLSERYLARSHHTPGTSLICLENTHNRAGGTVTNVQVHRACHELAQDLGVPVHLDGARLFNATISLGVEPIEVTSYVDTVSVCLSKGLCAPIGSVLSGSADFIDQARYWRKRFGGGMRQTGVIAACGLVAIETLIPRLAIDHGRANTLASFVSTLPGLSVVTPQTNIVMIDTVVPAEKWVGLLADLEVWVIAMGRNRLRAVLHHDITDEGLSRAMDGFKKVSDAGLR